MINPLWETFTVPRTLVWSFHAHGCNKYLARVLKILQNVDKAMAHNSASKRFPLFLFRTNIGIPKFQKRRL